MTTRKKKQDETLVDLVEVKDQAQDYFENNQLKVLAVLGVIVLVFGGWFGYSNLYQKPRNQNAMEQMFQAQFRFEQDSFAMALENPGGGYEGFLDIIDNYKGTQAANLANYYAGVSYLHLGRYEAAASFLETFKPKGEVTPIMKYGALGDAYSELGRIDEALAMYEKAARSKDNAFLTPYYLKKLGLLHELQGDLAASQEAYNEIKEKYPNSTVGRDIDKYLMRVSEN